MGAKPYFQLLRYPNAFLLSLYIASKILNRPGFHNIPCIQSACILLQVLCFDLLCKGLLTFVNPERQGITGCFPSPIVFNRNRDQIGTRVLWCPVQCQITAQRHIDTFHSTVTVLSGTTGNIRYDRYAALASFQLDL